MNRRSFPFWAGLALVALFGARAFTGLTGGVAFVRGSAAAGQGYYDTAIPHLEAAAVGYNTYEALWLEAEVRIGLYDMLQEVPGSEQEQDTLLVQALDGYRAAADHCPVSGWSWQGMSEVWFRREERRRAAETPDLSMLARPAWDRVGEEGRTGFGFLNWAIRKEPGIYTFRDRLVTRLLQFGLRREAGDAMARAAVQQPDFWRHTELQSIRDDDLLRRFAESSEAVLDAAPLISRERHLFSLGKLRYRIGDLDRAESLFRAARAEPATTLRHAEDAFHLALVLRDLERYDEARVYLEEAGTHEAFRLAVYSNLAEIARINGDLELAFDYFNRCRRMAPGSIRFALAFARVALRLERPAAAEQSLKWAAIMDPDNAAVWSELIGFYLSTGDLASTRTALREAGEELGDDHPLILEMSGRLAASLSSRDSGG